MSICSLLRGVERAFCARSSWNAATQETCPLRDGHAGIQMLDIAETCHTDSSSSPWKFWRRLSGRSRHDHKPLGRKEKPTIVLLEKSDTSQNPPEIADHRPLSTLGPVCRPLPDVVEKAPGVPRFSSNGVPPPKPPRLFLFRTPSTVTKHSTDTETDPTYMNSEQVTELKSHNSSTDSSQSQSLVMAANYVKTLKLSDMNENNNLLEHISKNESERTGSCDASFREPLSVSFHISPQVSTPAGSRIKTIPENTLHNSIQRKPKIKTPEMKRAGRPRRKSSDKGEMSRQKHIMSSVAELLRQRLDPYPLLDQLKRLGVLTNIDVQFFLGHHDRKSVCESLVQLIGDSTPDVLPVFCDVMNQSGNCTEILEVLQVMREMDRVIHDVPYNVHYETPVLADEKNINYEIGYLAPDHTLKPLVELERVRASTDKRLSKASSRNSAYSLLEGGDSESSKNGENGIFPGLIMMSVCVTGHNLSGQRSQALAQVIKNHNCICELRIGKTQLCGEDIQVICKALEGNRTIHSLDLRLNNIDLSGAQAIAELLVKTRSLRLLNLSSCGLDYSSIKAIAAAMASNRSLLDLDMSFLEMTDDSCQCLQDMLRANTTLQKVRLRSNNLTWSGCYLIAEGLVRNLSLNVLDLSRNPIADEGIQALAKFLPESSVSELCVENCGITSAGCEALAELVTHCKKLRHLDLSTNLLMDAGIFKLAAAIERSSTLQNLGLNMCGITNDGFSKLLDVLEKNTSIDHMKLCYNRLGREFSNPSATVDNLRYRLRIVTSSKPKLKILLWGNSFDESS
ncbi:uncharacterized protein LOC131948059 isoform X2 [Physella acuta]|uniref:uncharacterized protein LOC131948059 isoform X2 n=1 Tax=Physella acuta TaxID=109671 RepID=UPI0027DB0F18|nr:uncharacterized protein LOC131948059 isoform X2 [Physella acuta]XP_059165520.1 uncharacterized protein LOC131948059 isoform X2 [Physella acuta]XP_059165521.1 uncharacterized protein LOC131948059 isoform X2 [Physella acuta]